MNRQAGGRLAATAAAVAVLAASCGAPTRPHRVAGASSRVGPLAAAPSPLLVRVPADTPYVYAELDPLPAFALRSMNARLRAYRRLARVVEHADPERAASLPVAIRAGLALMDVIGEREGPDALRALGIDPGGRFVLYGQDIWPVLRISLSSPARVARTIDHVLRAIGARAETADRGTIHVWHAGAALASSGVDVLAAIDGDQLVVALAPASGDARDAFLRAVFDASPAESSLARAGSLAELTRKYVLGSGPIGFVDVDGTIAALAARGALDPGCQDEIESMLSWTPRVVFGTRALSPRGASVRVVVETRPDVRDMLQNARAAVASLSVEVARQVPVALGAGVDLRALADYLTPRIEGWRQRHRCSSLDWVDDAMARLDDVLAEVLRPPLSDVLGANLLIAKLDLTSGFPSTTTIAAAAFFGSRNPGDLLRALARVVSGLDPEAVREGAGPVRVSHSLPQLGRMSVARGKNAVGIALGAGDQLLRAHIDAAPDGGMPLFVVHWSGAFQRALAGALESHVQDGDELERALADVDRSQYDSWLVVGRTARSGIVIDGDVTSDSAPKASP